MLFENNILCKKAFLELGSGGTFLNDVILLLSTVLWKPLLLLIRDVGLIHFINHQ